MIMVKTKDGDFSKFLILFFMVVTLSWVPNMVMGQGGNQTTTTTLKIVVPVRVGFTGFVKQTVDPNTGGRDFGGFCIDVFKTVASSVLPQGVTYEFVPFAKPDGSMNGTYNDMLKAVLSKKYDGAVGDITIRFERAQWVDFTMPYTDTGVAMLVPLAQPKSTNKAGISLLPLVKGLLIGALALFVFTALFFCIFDLFKKSKGEQAQVGFGGMRNDEERQRETMKAIRDTRVMMALWFGMLLLLVTCYTASLTSLVTAEKVSVPTKNLNQLLRNGDNVGYSRNSFVHDYLTEKGFSNKQLIPFDTEDDMKNLLSKGTANGGVAAVIHETPYLQVFLAEHCGEYALVPNFKINAAGFGFAFQQGSSWVKPISNGILKILDGGQLAKIQDRNVGSFASCQGDSGAGVGSDAVNSGIVIAGIVCCLVIVVVLYVVFIRTKCKPRKQKVVNPRA